MKKMETIAQAATRIAENQSGNKMLSAFPMIISMNKTVAIKTTTLENSFHGTQIKIRGEHTWADIQASAQQEASDRTYGPARRLLRRIEIKLCGSRTCQCGAVRP